MKLLVFILILINIAYSQDDDNLIFENKYISNTFKYLEKNIQLLHSKINIYSKNIDEFISNEYDNLQYNDSYIVFENTFSTDKFERFKYEPNFILRIRMPKLEKKVSFEIDNIDDKILEDKVRLNEKLSYKDDRFNIGFIYNELNRNVDYSIKSGIKLTTKPFIFIKGSIKKPHYINDKNLISFKNEIRYTNRYKLDNFFSIAYTNYIDLYYTFSNFNEYFYNHETKDDIFYNSIRLKEKMNNKEYLHYIFSTNSNNIDTSLKIKEYNIYSIYKKYLTKWLYFGVIPSIKFQYEYDYKMNPGIQIKLGLEIKK